jgi:succinate-semialdehyde dehydrogenase/glutarate-semialdehyde dehydrogenase
MILKSINPFTNEIIEKFEEISGEMAEKVLTESGEAFEKWKRTDIEYRGSLMEVAAALLRSNINGMVKPIRGYHLAEPGIQVSAGNWLSRE